MNKYAYIVAHEIRKIYWRVVKPATFGVMVIIRHGDEVLFVRHSYGHQAWGFPTGGFNPKRETPEQAGAREVREELGLQLENIQLIHTHFSTAQVKRDTGYWLVAETANRDIRTSGEIAAYAWRRPSDLPEKINSYAEKALLLWLNGGSTGVAKAG